MHVLKEEKEWKNSMEKKKRWGSGIGVTSSFEAMASLIFE